MTWLHHLAQVWFAWIAAAIGVCYLLYIAWKLWRTFTGRHGMKEWKKTIPPPFS
jgi:threonine/homoserine/homoserine lactone efflux protein